MSHPTLRSALFLSSAFVLFALDASAQVTKDQCIDSNTSAQSLRRADKLSGARQSLKVCLDPHCPAMVRDDCAQRLDEIERVQPTIVFDAKDAADHDVSAVHVTIDGRFLTDKLDGAALAVDPGQHDFVFQMAGGQPVKHSFVLKEYEKARRERILMGSHLAVPASGPPPPEERKSSVPILAGPGVAQATPEHAPEGTPWKTVGLVAGGVGVAGLVAGAIVGSMANSAWTKSENECTSSAVCPDHGSAVSDQATALSDAKIATVAFVAGGLLVAGGLVLFFAPTSHGPAPAVGALWLAPGVGPGGGGLTLLGDFD